MLKQREQVAFRLLARHLRDQDVRAKCVYGILSGNGLGEDPLSVIFTDSLVKPDEDAHLFLASVLSALFILDPKRYVEVVGVLWELVSEMRPETEQPTIEVVSYSVLAGLVSGVTPIFEDPQWSEQVKHVTECWHCCRPFIGKMTGSNKSLSGDMSNRIHDFFESGFSSAKMALLKDIVGLILDSSSDDPVLPIADLVGIQIFKRCRPRIKRKFLGEVLGPFADTGAIFRRRT